ncbi:MAG: hypothetical protein J0L62_06985 [Bacteroidetes bacterium]|nr:hypothetical protein [Bacteroidota bacterium]
MSRFNFSILLFISIAFSLSCENTTNNSDDPITSSGVAETNTGQNTMGAVIDKNEAWAAGIQAGIPIPVPYASIQAARTGNGLVITGVRAKYSFSTFKPGADAFTIGIYADKPGEYNIGVRTDGSSFNSAWAAFYQVEGSLSYENGKLYSPDGITYKGKINLKTLDLTNKIASGTFSFTAFNKDAENKITTKTFEYGVFDVKFQ